jgi:hypothetical protein
VREWHLPKATIDRSVARLRKGWLDVGERKRQVADGKPALKVRT